MGELRKDYILDRWVLIAPGRQKRPNQFGTAHKPRASSAEERSFCFFCPGNEELTPKEVSRVEKGGRWVVRVVPNKFAAVEPQGQSEVRTDNTYYTFSANYGLHEVIIESPDHDRQLEDLSIQELEAVLQVYRKRIEELMLQPHVRFVDVFKNSGEKGGTSIVHTHTQVMALNHLPTLIREELEAFKRYTHCPYCDIISREKDSFRRCFENDGFVAFAPYASRFNYEVWIFPKGHVKNLSEVSDLPGLCDMLHKVLCRLKVLGVSYNFFLHYSPVEDFHFHIEVTPRIATWAGFEIGTDEVINTVSPESAAQFYRNENL